MKLSVIILTLLVAGCTTVPIVPKFPMVPEVLLESCGPLQTIDKETVFLSEFLHTVHSNYQKYHNCSSLVEEWQNWYKEQRKLHDSLQK